MNKIIKKNSLFQKFFKSKFYSTSSTYVKIGDAKTNVREPKDASNVPYVSRAYDLLLNTQESLEHLRWFIEKDSIGQDFVLIGNSSPYKRLLIERFCQLTNRELNTVILNRDTSESDIKQRREIVEKKTVFRDAAGVDAAKHGKILLLDGLEKVETNILPMLNNLIENRDLNLEDGTFLLNSERYDQLCEVYGHQQLTEEFKLTRVDPNFRVIAIYSPKYKFSKTIDPPFRSRFQSRIVEEVSADTKISILQQTFPNVDKELIHKLVLCTYSINYLSLNESFKDLVSAPFEFPLFSGLDHLVHLISTFPTIKLEEIVEKVYPSSLKLKLNNESQSKIVTSVFKKFFPNYDQSNKNTTYLFNKVVSERQSTQGNESTKEISFNFSSGDEKTFSVLGGLNKSFFSPEFKLTSTSQKILSEMLQDHISNRDFAIIGPKSSGKSSIANAFCNILGYSIESIDTVTLHSEISFHELFQTRIMDEEGNTCWNDSAMVKRAKNGGVIIFDCIERPEINIISCLQRLVQNREFDLMDGSKLVNESHYNHLRESYSEEELAQKKIFRVHPSFRMIFVGDIPNKKSYITEELLQMLSWHFLTDPTPKETAELLSLLVPKASQTVINKLLHFVSLIEEHKKKSTDLHVSISIRQLVRILEKTTSFDNQEELLYHSIKQNCYFQLLPSTSRQVIEKLLQSSHIKKYNVSFNNKNNLEQRNKQSGEKVINPKTLHLVPKVLFYETPNQMQIIDQLEYDFHRGCHLLLIGNQGVSKNKITDKLLERMQKERYYQQLHRDSTISSITQLTTFVDGKIVYQNSPLVDAVESGSVLVLDEADKCSLELLGFLKCLLIDGQLSLSDGRKIISERLLKLAGIDNPPKNIIKMNSNFRIICLANKGGFPFQGHNVLEELSGLFEVFIIENPEIESEIQLLEKFAPNVDKKLLRQLTSSFQNLRHLVNEGQLNYPYSLRENINIVKHLQAYPNDSVESALENVFSFDYYNKSVRELITKTFVENGIKLTNQFLSPSQQHSSGKGGKLSVEYLNIRSSGDKVANNPKFGKIDPTGSPHVGGNTWAGGSGGRDTAGLGGRGGYMRLTDGNPVYQIPDEEKKNVTEEAKKLAREMASKALNEKLSKMDMSLEEAKLYERYYQRVEKSVNQLCSLLESLQSNSKSERKWIKRSEFGEFDENRVVEALLHQKDIYKKRGVPSSHLSSQNQKPKRIRFVFDLSGSMYRFNGYDGRLERSLEAFTMINESFKNFPNKVEYDICGHSGDTAKIQIVNLNQPPKDRKEVLLMMQKMVAHTQYCESGDHTVEATELAIDELSKVEERDEKYTIIISDANFDRYYISPHKFSQILVKDKDVKAVIIFVGSLGREAASLVESLPVGHAFLCETTEDLPLQIQKILQESITN